MDKNITIGPITMTQQLTQHFSGIERLAPAMLQRERFTASLACWQLKRRLARVVNTDTQGALQRSDTAIWKGIAWFGRNRSDWIRALAFCAGN